MFQEVLEKEVGESAVLPPVSDYLLNVVLYSGKTAYPNQSIYGEDSILVVDNILIFPDFILDKNAAILNLYPKTPQLLISDIRYEITLTSYAMGAPFHGMYVPLKWSISHVDYRQKYDRKTFCGKDFPWKTYE